MKRVGAICILIFATLTSFNEQNCLSVRFKNSTDKEFTNLKVWTASGEIVLKNLKQGEVSSAYHVPWSYKFTYAVADTKDGAFITPGYCRTGEIRYENGEILMEFTITPESYKHDPREKAYLFIKATIKEALAGKENQTR